MPCLSGFIRCSAFWPGSVTLTGGPATGLAFAPLFEKAGVSGAATVAIAAAMFGIVSGGLLAVHSGHFLSRGTS